MEKNDLGHELTNVKEELKSQAHQLSLLRATLGRMPYLYKEMLDCRPPTRVYTLFLQEKWFEYQFWKD